MAGEEHPLSPISLVLLPGMHGSGCLFAPFLRELPDYIKPVPISYPPDQPLDYAGHLAAVMAALPVEGPYLLLGESFSGPLALMAASRKPKGLAGVILCATFVSYPLSLPASFAAVVVAMGMFRLKSMRLFARILLGGNATDELKKLFSLALADVQPRVLAGRAKAVFELDVTAELRECPVPLLVLQAGSDRIVSRRSVEQLRNLHPDADFVVIHGPHLILQCAAEEAVRAIRRFVEKLSRPSDSSLEANPH